jgi:outer membrane protein OmpA-like peptidoglycan-associated protein
VGTTQCRGEIPIDVLVIRDGDRLKMRISNITFAPNSPAFFAADEAVLERNFEIVNRIAEILGRYRSYQFRIEGHAVNISGTQREQQEELIPLSRARAETVLQALVERGLDQRRFTAVGIGGADPIVPHTDLENRWRNRRVEFVLIR